MGDLARMLSKVRYRELARICGEEGLRKSGKKVDLVKRLVESVPEETLRVYIIEFMGIGKRILEHDLVPEHKIMKADDVKKLIKKYGIKKWQLPKIFDKDPIVMLLGAKPGDILKIKRKSQTAGVTTYYRLVVRSGS
jgi:DNA-directed RNA polymerase subunit H